MKWIKFCYIRRSCWKLIGASPKVTEDLNELFLPSCSLTRVLHVRRGCFEVPEPSCTAFDLLNFSLFLLFHLITM